MGLVRSSWRREVGVYRWSVWFRFLVGLDGHEAVGDGRLTGVLIDMGLSGLLFRSCCRMICCRFEPVSGGTDAGELAQ